MQKQRKEGILTYDATNSKYKNNICKLGRALSVPERLDILQLIQEKPCNLIELSNKLNLPISSISFHIKALEEANLIRIDYKPAQKGHMKLCSLKTIRVTVGFAKEIEPENDAIITEIPVGLYSECNVTNAYLASDKEFIFREYFSSFMLFTPDRVNGELFAFQNGYVVYSFPNHFINNQTKRNLSFSFECCSEAPFYREDWPSDITVWVNDLEIATTRLTGDFGGTRGTYTPEYWQTNSTQFGVLKKFTINDTGCFVDNVFSHRNITFSDLNLDQTKEIKLKIGFKKDAKHIGGINIFGKNFGNYPQAIQMILSNEK